MLVTTIFVFFHHFHSQIIFRNFPFRPLAIFAIFRCFPFRPLVIFAIFRCFPFRQQAIFAVNSLPHRLLTTLYKKYFENIAGKEEIAGNQHLLHSPQCFLPFLNQIQFFSHLYFVVCKCFQLVFW